MIKFIEVPNWMAVPYYGTSRLSHHTDAAVLALLERDEIKDATVWCWNTDGKDGQIRNHAVRVGKVEEVTE